MAQAPRFIRAMPRPHGRSLLAVLISVAALGSVAAATNMLGSVAAATNMLGGPIPGPAAHFSARQLVESRHFDRAGRSRVGQLHHVHRTCENAAPGLRR